MKSIDLSGQVFGRLTVIHEGERRRDKRRWACECECGNSVVVSQDHLRRGHTTSCGCYRREVDERRRAAAFSGNIPEYDVWAAMNARCFNPNCKTFYNYGERGITVCDQWHGPGGFLAFMHDMGSRPTEKHTIERIDNDGPYSPTNCRWATRGEQSRNTRRTRMLTFGGQTMPMQDWGALLGIKPVTILQRLDRSGWSVERALSTPVGKGSRQPGEAD